jgi:hypothetical protein
MARQVAYSLMGLFVVFLGLLLVLPYVKSMFPQVSGFNDMTMATSCEEGRTPCPEGYFCEQKTCVPILPRYNIESVQPNSQSY